MKSQQASILGVDLNGRKGSSISSRGGGGSGSSKQYKLTVYAVSIFAELQDCRKTMYLLLITTPGAS